MFCHLLSQNHMHLVQRSKMDHPILKDPKYLELVKMFAKDKDAMDTAFSHAWYKLMSRDMGPHTRCKGNKVPPAQVTRTQSNLSHCLIICPALAISSAGTRPGQAKKSGRQRSAIPNCEDAEADSGPGVKTCATCLAVHGHLQSLRLSRRLQRGPHTVCASERLAGEQRAGQGSGAVGACQNLEP